MKQFIDHINSFWSWVVVSFLGGLAAIWWVTERLKTELGWLIVQDPSGVALNSTYALRAWFVFGILLLFLILLMAVFSLSRELVRIRPDTKEVSATRQMLDDLLSCARNVTAATIYTSPDGRPRIDITRMRVTHVVEKDGSTRVTRSYSIYCPKDKAHAFEIWIEADDESDPLLGFRSLNIQASDKTNGRDLDWIPTGEALRKKRIAVFFPELREGETRELEISHCWPGYLRRVLERGSTEFWWTHKAATQSATAEVTYEWIFRLGFPQVTVKTCGIHGASATLTVSHRPDGVHWVYSDPNAQVDKRDYRISIERVLDSEKHEADLVSPRPRSPAN